MTEHPLILLQEYKQVVATLPEADVEVIQSTLKGKIELSPTGIPSSYLLQANSWVGFVRLPSGRILEVQPKVQVPTLFSILARVYQPDQKEIFDPETITYTTIEDFFEYVVTIFTSQVEDLILGGILKSYRSVQEDLISIRGRLMLPETWRHRPGLHDRHTCSFHQFTPDIIENQVLRLAAYVLKRYPYKEQAVSSRLMRIEQALVDVNLDPLALDAFDDLEFHRLNEHYRPALVRAKLLLDHLTFTGTAGEEAFMAYMVDMNSLFQRYLTVMLEEELSEAGIEVLATSRRWLDHGKQIEVEPDIILAIDREPVLIVDAKYKLAEHHEDVYQMLAYCHAMNLDRAVLIHPAHEWATKSTHQILGWGHLTI